MLFQQEHYIQRIRISNVNYFSWWTAEPQGFTVRISNVRNAEQIYKKYITGDFNAVQEQIIEELQEDYNIQYVSSPERITYA